jgi:hypothetical protein
MASIFSFRPAAVPVSAILQKEILYRFEARIYMNMPFKSISLPKPTSLPSFFFGGMKTIT